MSDKKHYKTELEKLDFEGKETDLAKTRRQQTSTPIKKTPVDTNNSSVSGSSDLFKSFNSDDTIVPEPENIVEFSVSLVDLSIDSVFDKVKINKNKMATQSLTLDKMMSILPTFNGNFRDLASFIRVAELIFAKIPAEDKLSEPVFLEVVLSKLIGDAQFLYKNGSSFATWVLLKAELKKQFTKKLRTSDIERTLSQIFHRRGESVHNFSLRLKEIWYLLGETLADITDQTILQHCKKDFEEKIISSFKNSLAEPLRSWIKSKTFATFVEAVEFAEKEENMAYGTVPKVLGNETNNHNRNMDNITGRMANAVIRENRVCYSCNQIGHVTSECVKFNQRNQIPRNRQQSFNRGFNPNFNRRGPMQNGNPNFNQNGPISNDNRNFNQNVPNFNDNRNFNRNGPMPISNGQQNQPRYYNNSTQNSKNYVAGQANNIRRIHTVVNEQPNVPVYYSQ